MTQDQNKEVQEASLIGKLLSMDALILVMGVASLIYGVMEQIAINIFWGCLIIAGFFILLKVRKKDWKKHWEEMEAEHTMRKELAERRRNASQDEPPR